MYECINNLLLLAFNILIIMLEDITSKVTCDSDLFYLPNSHLICHRTSLFYSGPSLWNGLPESIHYCPSFTIFKIQLKAFYRLGYQSHHII